LFSILSIPIIIVLIYLYALYGALAGVSLYFITDFVFKLVYLRHFKKHLKFPTPIKQILKKSKHLISFSLPLSLAFFVNSLSFWYARVIVVNSSQGFSDIAVFDAAYQMLTIIMLITGATTSVALPMLSKAYGRNKKKEVSKIFFLNLVVNAGIAIGISAFFIIFSKNIMALYGPKYISGNIILIVLSISSTVFAISSIYNKYMITHNKTWIVFFASLFGSAALFIVLELFIKLHALGLACALFTYYSTTIFIYIIIHLVNRNNFTINVKTAK